MTDAAAESIWDLALEAQARGREAYFLLQCIERATPDRIEEAIYLTQVAQRVVSESTDIGEKIELAAGANRRAQNG